MLIDLRVYEEKLAVFIVHQIDEECGKGETNYLLAFKLRRFGAHAADEAEQLIKIASIEDPSFRDIADAVFKIDFQGWTFENKFLEVLDLGDQTCLCPLNVLPFLEIEAPASFIR